MRQFLLAVALIAGSGASLGAQVKGVRFEISQVGDTTVAFTVGAEGWVHRGLTGLAVDPLHRDALVARLRVTSVDRGVATALIIGQTTRLTTDQWVILEEPPRPWFKRLYFWGGLAVGFALGVVVRP
jgi:hypothetical protein